MKRFYLSCDIEGTCGIAAWDETEAEHSRYNAFADQMSREVAAACDGLLSADAECIRVRDAHDSARNLRPAMLPQSDRISLLRGWCREPLGMVAGIDQGYDGILFTGYHSACGWNGNPLSHTMNTTIYDVKINGETASELMINSLTASMAGVPVLMVTGDKMLCDWFHTKVPAAITVPVSDGEGSGSVALMPDVACSRIRESAVMAAALDPAVCMYPMPEHFDVEITYKEHYLAHKYSWYPGATQKDSRTVAFSADCWMDVLVFFHFCL